MGAYNAPICPVVFESLQLEGKRFRTAFWTGEKLWFVVDSRHRCLLSGGSRPTVDSGIVGMMHTRVRRDALLENSELSCSFDSTQEDNYDCVVVNVES